jgi:hypothetical protein
MNKEKPRTPGHRTKYNRTKATADRLAASIRDGAKMIQMIHPKKADRLAAITPGNLARLHKMHTPKKRRPGRTPEKHPKTRQKGRFFRVLPFCHTNYRLLE